MCATQLLLAVLLELFQLDVQEQIAELAE